MDNKEKVVVFGCGRLYQERKEMLYKKCNVICFLDNNYENQKSIDNIPVYNPRTLSELEEYPILIMSDYIVDILRQLHAILGEELNMRILYARLFLPVTEEEKLLAKEKIKIIINNNKVFALLNKNHFVELENDLFAIKKIYREYTRSINNFTQELIKMPLKPVDSCFGIKRGTPIDRWYIENWLYHNSEYINGDVMEIAEDTYTKRFGADDVTSHILHVAPECDNQVKGNFETGEGINDSSIDCLILTQTIPVIYDIKSVIKNVYTVLRPGGTALITSGGISQISRYDMDRWGHYWSLTELSMKRIIEEAGFTNYKIDCYGNVKTACALLYGVAAEELSMEDIEYFDPDYTVSICARVTK